jgi:DNA-binding GntR family transcriptional regulator
MEGLGRLVSSGVPRPVPPYVQITEHYRDLIKSGELKDGDRLPSTRQLVEQWSIAHATAAKVISILRAEGLVATVPGGGGGTIVAAGNLHRAPRDRMIAVRRRGRIYPPNEHARIVSADLLPAPDHIAEVLGVAAGSAVIRRRRITYRDDTPVSASTSWFTGDLAASAPALLGLERIIQGTPGYVEQQTGRVMSRGRDHVTAGLADRDAAHDLAVPEGSPVLLGRNWVTDQAGEVLEYGEYVSAAGRWSVYEYDLG